MTTLTISRRFTHGDDLVVIRRQEYEHLKKRLVEIKDALSKIRRGESEFKRGKTQVVHSLSELRK